MVEQASQETPRRVRIPEGSRLRIAEDLRDLHDELPQHHLRGLSAHGAVQRVLSSA